MKRKKLHTGVLSRSRLLHRIGSHPSMKKAFSVTTATVRWLRALSTKSGTTARELPAGLAACTTGASDGIANR